MSAANKVTYGNAGLLGDIDTKQRNPLGLIEMDEYGNEYIYAAGVASLAAGDWVTVNSDYSVARALNTPLTGRVAVAMAANILSTNWSWYQITGLVSATTPGNGVVTANIGTDASGDKKPLFMSSTPGRASTTVAAGQAILGAWASGNPASNTGNAWLTRPFAPGFTLASA